MLKPATTGIAIQEIGAKACEASCRNGGGTVPFSTLIELIVGITAAVDGSPRHEGSR